MGTIRYFSGGREGGKRSVAAELMRLEIEKKGKFQPGERYKILLKKKLAASREKAMLSNPTGRKMSKKAEQALREIAAKKAAKEAKAMRRMVIVQPKIYHNGKINAKGKITDIEGNIVAQVNTKNGKMATTGGWALGKYQGGSQRTHAAIMGAIDKYSPYYIKQRQLQQAGNGGTVLGQQEVMNLYGSTNYMVQEAAPQPVFQHHHAYGQAAEGPRQNIGVTAWGAMADNPWGTFADNAWGTSADNVWGTASTNVWGGLGGSPFGGGKGVQLWGTGNGKNYLKSVTTLIKAYFGMSSKSGKAAFKTVVQSRVASNRAGSGGGNSAVARSAVGCTAR